MIRKPRKSKLQNQSLPIAVCIGYFVNLLKPVNIKGTLKWRRLLYYAKGKVDDETLQMIKKGEVFQGDVKNIDTRVVGSLNFPKRQERIARQRIVREPIKIEKEEYQKYVCN